MAAESRDHFGDPGGADPVRAPRGRAKHVISNLLISEPPLQVLPTLAVAVGLGEAIFLQQLHYWLERATVHRDGRSWVYNTLEEWQQQLPFWSVATLRRVIASLEAKGYVAKSFLASDPRDRTAYYTINYAAVASMQAGPHPSNPSPTPCAQFEQMHLSRVNRSKRSDRADVLSTETTATEILSCRKERGSPGKRPVVLSGMVCWTKADASAVEQLLDRYGRLAVGQAVEACRSSSSNRTRARERPFPSEVESLLKQGPTRKELICAETDTGNAGRRADSVPGDPLAYYAVT